MTNPNDQDPQDGSPDLTADPQSAAPGTTQIDWESDENPYRPFKDRFEGYRRTADQKITRLSQYEQAVQDFQSGDPAEMRRAAAVLGIGEYLEIEDPDPPTYDDPSDELRAQIEALRAEQEQFKGQLTAREQKEAEAAQVAEVNSRLDKLGITDEQERNVVLGAAFTMPMDDAGLPDVAAAAKFIEARDRARFADRFADYKASKRAPTSIQPGQTGTGQKSAADMTDSSGLLTQEGLDYYAQRMEDMA